MSTSTPAQSETAILQNRIDALEQLLRARDDYIQQLEQTESDARTIVNLRQREARYRALVEVASSIVWVLSPTGQGSTDLSSWCSFTGQSPHEIVGFGFLAAVHPDDLESVRLRFRQAIASRSVYQDAYRLRRHDGVYREFEVRAVPLLDQHGEIREWAGAHTDVTERNQAEREARQLQEAVIQMQQQLLTELSTPLIPISDQIVVMPLIGTIDTGRVQQVLDTLLHGVEQHRPRVAILDITGVPVVDTQVAHALVQAAQAVRLLGTEAVLTGIRPDVASTLVMLGVNLHGLVTRGSLRDGIAYTLGN